jgi:hypothetical protein
VVHTTICHDITTSTLPNPLKLVLLLISQLITNDPAPAHPQARLQTTHCRRQHVFTPLHHPVHAQRPRPVRQGLRRHDHRERHGLTSVAGHREGRYPGGSRRDEGPSAPLYSIPVPVPVPDAARTPRPRQERGAR